jgi:hypothetical protein
MRRNIVFAGLLTLFSLSLPCYTMAAVVEFAFEGRVDGVGLPVYGLNPAIGSPVTGSFSYDTTLTVPPITPSIAGYQIFSPYSFFADIDGTRIESGGFFNITIMNDGGSMMWVDKQPFIVGGTQTTDGVFGLSFSSTNPNLFAGLSLPESLILSDFDNWHNGGITRAGNNQEIISFSIDRLTPVPVPAAVVLFPTGLSLLAISFRRL